jgi:DNA repair protein RadC
LRQHRTKGKNGRYRLADRATICETASQYADPITGQSIRSPLDTETFLRNKLAHLEHEVFCCIYLDNRHRVLKFSELFRGTIDGTSVYPREIAKEALQVNAAAVILAHNHPSGIAEPSQADERITRRVKAGLELLDIRLLDHLLIGGSKCVSLASRGCL